MSSPQFEPAYLVHGDDHGRVAERRGRLASLAAEVSGAQGVEAFDASQSLPGEVASALGAMTFAIGRRFLIVDGCESWKEKEVAEDLAPAMAALDEETTVAFFACEDGRRKAPSSLHDAVEAAGGRVSAEMTLKARELPRWAVGQASGLGLELDGAAAQLLVAQVGEHRAERGCLTGAQGRQPLARRVPDRIPPQRIADPRHHRDRRQGDGEQQDDEFRLHSEPTEHGTPPRVAACHPPKA